MSDLISRQAAIDAVCAVCVKSCDKIEFVYNAPQDEQVILCPEHYVLCTLPSAQPEQQWIPCSERLPDKYGLYLVTMTEKAKAEDLGFDLDEIDVRRMRYNSNGWLMPRHIPAWINAAVTDEVIAWMPLPEPYREDGAE